MISVAECKEKWRNLRTVFMRKMKPSPSGSGGKKKAYYLENAMQFCLPFIKTVAPPSSGNLQPVPQTQQLTGDVEDSETQVEDSVTQVEDSATQLQEASTQQPSPTSPLLLTELSIKTSDRPRPTSSSSKRNLGQTVQKQNKNSASVADLSVAEYFKAKKAKLESNAEVETGSHTIDRQQGLKMFLLSLIPELEELNDSQIKLFKRRVLRVIDDIAASGHQPQTPSGLTILTSPSLSDSTLSQMSNMANALSQMPAADYYNTFSQNVDHSDM